MKITKDLVRKLRPSERDTYIWDDQLPGFGIRVHPTGRKIYLVRYRTEAGTQRKFTIGLCETLHPDDARRQAADVLSRARQGSDPTRERKDHRHSPTIADLATAHQAIHKPPTIKAGTARNYEILWRRHILPRIGNLKVSDVSVTDIQFQLHMDMGDRPYNANRALELVCKALSDCEKWKWKPLDSNPAKHVPAFPEKERQRILSHSEIRALMAHLDVIDARNVSSWSVTWLIRVLLLSGLRVSEWSLAEWKSVNFDNGTLFLADSKTGSRTVHLSDSVLETLRQLKSYRRHLMPWIFPNSDGSGPLRWPHQHWHEIRHTVGLDDVRLHDLRHTFGSLGHMAGLSQRDIADMLGHRQLRTTERYLHTYDENKRSVANTASSHIMSIISTDKKNHG